MYVTQDGGDTMPAVISHRQAEEKSLAAPLFAMDNCSIRLIPTPILLYEDIPDSAFGHNNPTF
jgi:hypothetical protein